MMKYFGPRLCPLFQLQAPSAVGWWDFGFLTSLVFLGQDGHCFPSGCWQGGPLFGVK